MAHKAEVSPLLIYPAAYSLDFGLASFTPLYVPNTYRSVSWSIFTSLMAFVTTIVSLAPNTARRHTVCGVVYCIDITQNWSAIVAYAVLGTTGMQTPDNSGYGYIVYTYDIRSAYDLCISISIRFMTVY